VSTRLPEVAQAYIVSCGENGNSLASNGSNCTLYESRVCGGMFVYVCAREGVRVRVCVCGGERGYECVSASAFACVYMYLKVSVRVRWCVCVYNGGCKGV
jgi:hypothetical protein